MYHNLMIKRYIKNWSITKNIRNYFRTKKIISNSDGQIKINSSSGQLLTNFIKQNKISTVLEIGTWNGLGSTSVIYSALKSKDSEFYLTSIETDKIAYKAAKNNLKNHEKVNLLYGRIIEIDELPNAQDIDFQSHNLETENAEWLIQDIRRYRKTENILNKLDDFYDLIFLDGGEFSTFAEFKKLYTKTSYIALDDINTYKQFEVLNFIKDNREMFEILENSDNLSIYKVKI